ncbi:respiratory nitrate reductase subunit gamma [Shewanella schlegeliana]|uniref:Respiratory nitrate reductase subunit gamma n=1 Tax=Shewanella schlegeliana TaxID=190308 RepID=A0ABS1T5D8_9GAMM|nr:respiratory nitrate reductase subunit gamma [Shewanella schlegeliana]MBL4914721.1 respiratory nitrate reductase subunit gamma [Shewanella schlegeliana]MCL1109947.1 respiratory nitrate reductase subunit gamma [Shewanella schlegeliana]GIU25527.1 respiratory nitrate reductase subunit gamma [Shewanella schlegeliana]
MSNLNFLLFGIYPFVAIAVFFIGCWIRYDREPYSWKADSSQIFDQKGFRLASYLFHIGVIFILGGHFVGLLTPESIYHHFISTPDKQLLAMVSGGFFGILCFIGTVMLIRRRLNNDRVKANTKRSDLVVLFLLLLQVTLGLLTIVASAQHLDGSVMVLLADWAQSIVTLQGVQATESIESVNIIYKLHILVGLTLIMIFPFTRLVHVISVPVKYFTRGYQIVRQR